MAEKYIFKGSKIISFRENKMFAVFNAEQKVSVQFSLIFITFLFITAFTIPFFINLFSAQHYNNEKTNIAQNNDPDLLGANWYLTGWHLEYAANYIKEFTVYDGRSVFHGLINDTKGKAICSVSIAQGYPPQGWGIPYWEGNHEERNRLKSEGKVRFLKVRFQIVNYTFNLDSSESYGNHVWVTVGIDIRGSVKGRSYNAKWYEGGKSWVFCANLFAIGIYGSQYYSTTKDQVIVSCEEFPPHEEGGETTKGVYHYSVAMLNSESIKMGVWYEYTFDLRRYFELMQKDLGFEVDKVHYIQPFIETCGGCIEAYFDYVELF